MKEIKKEVVSYETAFVAVDGTEFWSQDECEEYEKKVLFAKYEKLIVKTGVEEEIFSAGIPDNNVDFVRVESQEDADLIMQILLLLNPYYKAESNRNSLEKAKESLKNSIGDIMLVGRGFDPDEEYFWLYGSKNEIVQNFLKYFD